MKSVGANSNILKVSIELKAGLESLGRKRDVPPAQVLFREDGESAGVFLVGEGEVLMGRSQHAQAGQGLFRGLAPGIARLVYRTSVQLDRRYIDPVGGS